MMLKLERCELRSWRVSDAESMVRYANNRKIWLNLRDAFPSPYTRPDAERFIAAALEARPECRFAICVGDEAVGSIGYRLHTDVERISAEIGYWLGEPFWGKGIMSDALGAVTRHAIREHGLTRVFAVPYDWNPASFRVLEKSGFVLEGRMRKSAIKDGTVLDQLLYAFVVESSA